MNAKLILRSFLFVLLCGGLSLASIRCQADSATNVKCSEEANKLGLSGPERWDFREKCKGSGRTFATTPMERECRQIVANDGLARIELNKLELLCKNKEKENEIIKINNTLIDIWSRNLSLLEKSVSKCSFTDQSINALRGVIANLKAGSIDACSPVKSAPYLK